MRRGMEAVFEKGMSGKKRPAFAKKGKGPGVAIMIAMGKPKPPMPEDDEAENEEEMGGYDDKYNERRSSTDPIIAKIEKRLAVLEKKLAEYEGAEPEAEEDAEYEDEEEDE